MRRQHVTTNKILIYIYIYIWKLTQEKKKKKLSLSITEEKNYGNRNVENLEALAILRRRETCNTRPNKAHLKIGPIVTTNESSVTRANCLLFSASF